MNDQAAHSVRQALCVRLAICVRGAVQGVGFRPFAWQLAHQLNCTGWVRNDASGVNIEVQGQADAVERFRHYLTAQPPPLAEVSNVEVRWLPLIQSETEFVIRHSQAQAGISAFVSPDVATCDACLNELNDPHNRRFAYPFINCTHCGPRFTIQMQVPYDRCQTTMHAFPMCETCLTEYRSPDNRRFHAQPNACPECGPGIWLVDASETLTAKDGKFSPARQAADVLAVIEQTRQWIAEGKTVAIKGLGGFHLTCDARQSAAVTLLRSRKQRHFKPFAVMAADVQTAQSLVLMTASEQTLLTSRQRPIVIMRQRAKHGLAEEVAPGNPYLGVMLPYTPLHHLLLRPGDVWIMTSGNVSDEPLAYKNGEAIARLSPLCDAFLMHDRPIYTVCDDSVMHTTRQLTQPLRRSRGYAPLPIVLPRNDRTISPSPTVLAVGGEIKSALCLAHGNHAFLSQHVGDMGNRETLRALDRAAQHLQDLYQTQPRIVAADLHPGYISSQWAERCARDLSAKLIRVQHHHAHVASLIAEHHLPSERPIIACVFDGTGYGSDGAIWGGEFLIASCAEFRRSGCLRYGTLPGGDSCIALPAKSALAFLQAYGLEWQPGLECVQHFSVGDLQRLRLQLKRGLNVAPTSSMGRMFDVVASLLGLRHAIEYEGQAAVELEVLAEQHWEDSSSKGAYPFNWQRSETSTLDLSETLRGIIASIQQGEAKGEIAARWHRTIALAAVEHCRILRQRDAALNKVGLTGGVFQNRLLTEVMSDELERAGFEVLIHRNVPCNDGGLALGQAVVAREWSSRPDVGSP